MKSLLLLALLGACNPYLMAESAAPPGRTARLDEVNGFWSVKSYRLELSTGVAVAVSCRSGGPCEHVVVTSDSPAVAEVRAASLGVLERSGMYNQATAAAVVVVGKAAGTTKLHLSAKEGHREIVVTIVPAPAPVTPRTAAR